MPTYSLEQLKQIYITKNIRKPSDNLYEASKSLIPHADAISLLKVLEDFTYYYPVNSTLSLSLNASSASISASNTITIPSATTTLAGVMSASQVNTLNSLVTLSGVPALSTHLGTFSGSVIPNNATIKEALEALDVAFTAGADGNGIYSGSGTVPASTVATLSGIFKFRYDTTYDAITINPSTNHLILQGRHNTPSYAIFEDENLTLTSGATQGITLQPHSIGVYGNIGLPSVRYVPQLVNISTSNDDWQPTNHDLYSFFRLQASAPSTISGVDVSQAEGRVLHLYNNSAHPITLLNQSTLSANHNRFDLGSDYVLQPFKGAMLFYSGSRWRGVAINDGNGIYSGSGQIPANTTATVSSGSVFRIDHSNGNAAFSLNDSSSVVSLKSANGNVSVDLNNSAVQLANSNFNLTLSSLTTFTDNTAAPKGIQYAANYHSTYTARSLVDREYVDNRALPSPIAAGTFLMSNGTTFIEVVEQNYTLTGHNSSVVNLPHIPLSYAPFKAFVNGIIKKYTDDYTRSGNTVTFNFSIVTSDHLLFIYYTTP